MSLRRHFDFFQLNEKNYQNFKLEVGEKVVAASVVYFPNQLLHLLSLRLSQWLN